MGRPSKFSAREKADIFLHIELYLEYIDEKACRLTVSDAEMSNILSAKGYDINAKYIERIRRSSQILACGDTGGVRPGAGRSSGSVTKFDNETMNRLREIIKDHTNEFWQLNVSDSRMTEIIINEAGYPVNVQYVRRMRQGLGIKPLDQRGGYREGAGRPSMTGTTQDLQYADVIALHNSAVAQLSYHRKSSGALRGQSGADVYDRFGYHTTDYEDAVKRKEQQMKTQNKATPVYKPILPGDEDVYIGTRNHLINYARRFDLVQARAAAQTIETFSVYDEEINKRTTAYGKSGKAGGVQNTRTSQVLSSL